MIHSPSSENSIATIAATSRGSPSRALREWASIAFWNSGVVPARICSVQTKPGVIELARTPCFPQREATWRISAFTAAFDMA